MAGRQLQAPTAAAAWPLFLTWSARHGAVVFWVALASLHSLVYGLVTPPWQAPDETAHVEHAVYVARTGRFLGADDATSETIGRAISQSLRLFRAYDYLGYAAPEPWPDRLRDLPFYGSSTTQYRSSLAYLVYGLIAWPFANGDILVVLYGLRLASVVMAGLGMALVYETARLIAPETPAVALGAALVYTFVPQHAYLLGMVNDGNLAELLASLSIYSALRTIIFPARRLPWAGLSVGSALAAQLVKGTALFLVPTLGVLALWGLNETLRQGSGSRRLGALAAGLGLLVVAFVVAYLTPFRWHIQFLWNNLAQDWSWGLQRRIQQAKLLDVLWTETYRSLWANLGWLRVPLADTTIYQVTFIAVVIGALGLGLGGWRVLRQRSGWSGWLLGVSAASGLLVPLLAYVFFPISAPLTQGRYLFAAWLPLGTLLSAGWVGLVRRPRASLALLGLFLIALDALVLWGTALPFFYR